MTTKIKDSSGSGAEQWFLKIDDGTIFGPVPARSLRHWAEQGRIAPGNRLSKDKIEWIVAESMPELEMIWWVERDDGSLQGPFNRKALDSLISDGTIPGDARIIERNPEETPEPIRNITSNSSSVNSVKIQKKRNATDQRRIRELENRLQESLTELEKMRQASRPKINVPEEVLRLRRELEKTRTSHSQLEKETDALKKEKASLQKNHIVMEEHIAMLEEAADSYEEPAPSVNLQPLLDNARQKLRESEEIIAEQNTRIEELTKPSPVPPGEEQSSEESDREKDILCQTLRKQLAEQEELFDEERQQLEEQMQDLRAGLETARTAQKQALTQLEEEKRTLAETLEESNTVDAELKQRLAEAENRLNEGDAPFREPGPELMRIIRTQIERTEDALKSEDIFFENVRDSFVEKQRALREQMRQLQAISPDAWRYADKTEDLHSGEETTRLRERMLHAEQEHRREKERADNREKELLRKIEQFDVQLTETRQRLAQAENEAVELRSIRDELRSKEHQITMLRAQYNEERAITKAQENDLTRNSSSQNRLASHNTKSLNSTPRSTDDTIDSDDHFNIRRWIKLR